MKKERTWTSLHCYRNWSRSKTKSKFLEERKAIVRTDIAAAVVAAGGRIAVEGIAVASMSKPSTRVSYDAKAVDTIMAKALADGNIHTANALASARTESVTKGHLIVKAEK
jgi:hypothetical protein